MGKIATLFVIFACIYYVNAFHLELPSFPDLEFPEIPIPSPEAIENLKPSDDNNQVAGAFASESVSFKVVDGKVVEDKKHGVVITNENGVVDKKEFHS